MRGLRIPVWGYDAAVLLVAGVHLLLVIRIDNQPAATFAIIGVAALIVRRRFPLAVFIVTLPAAFMVTEKVASLFALYALAYRSRTPLVPALGAIVLAYAFSSSDPMVVGNLQDTYGKPILFGLSRSQVWGLREIMFYLLIGVVAVVFGYLQRTRHDLAERLCEITEAREHQQELRTQQALAAERAQLAREMHDVVSHQVSLIAVQAGALQMQTRDPETKQSASTIRRLSVKTLEELRHMVKVLRASGVKTTELSPQPTIAQLQELVDGSGVEAVLEIGTLPEVDPPLQRAIYRTVQEGLTNVRKHAPGARVSVRVDTQGDRIAVEVVNAVADRPVVDLPSARHGLMGLRQRAELLGGELDYGPTDDDGWRLRVRLPLRVTSAVR